MSFLKIRTASIYFQITLNHVFQQGYMYECNSSVWGKGFIYLAL